MPPNPTRLDIRKAVHENHTLTLETGGHTMKRLSVFVLFALLTTMALTPLAKAQDGNVILSPDAIDAMEIENETGATQSMAEGPVTLNGGPVGLFVVVETGTIIAPTSGYVLAIGSGQLHLPNFFAQSIEAELGVSDDCDASVSSANTQTVHIQLGNAEHETRIPFSTQRLYPVTAGAQTFCIVGKRLFPASELMDVERMSLTLQFIPTAYGTVEPS